jgi:hypothetical protein
MNHSTKAIRLSYPILAAAILLGGCNSKPSGSDVERELLASYDCPLLEITDVNKVDGAPRNDGDYEVAFTYQVKLVGGVDKAVPYFSDMNAAQEEERQFATQEHGKNGWPS